MNKKNLAYLLAPMLLLACGDDDDDVIDGSTPSVDAAIDGGTEIDAIAELDATPGFDAAPDFDAPPPAPMVLTSTAFDEGDMLASTYGCQSNGGDNISPPLAWTAGPEGTKSYAVTFIDLDNGGPEGFPHSTIYDIPTSVLSLPEDISKVFEPSEVPGAKQSKGYNGSTNGYLGPCPGSIHTYQFTIHALDVATVPGLTVNSSASAAVAAIEDHSIASATLSVESD